MIVCSFQTKSSTAPVLDFFNVAKVDELTVMNGCSRKKAAAIIKMRPFSDWDELVRGDLLCFYNAIIHPVLEYASPVWH